MLRVLGDKKNITVNNIYHVFPESFIVTDIIEAIKKNVRPSLAFGKRGEMTWSKNAS